ncbi:fas-binding factor 1 [Caloenas nicobarica]|uniref:fas-binding factor 1 n=1 Tax=Caloenas nicobarica TaxID=187106 RepID=UPI0032B76C4E
MGKQNNPAAALSPSWGAGCPGVLQPTGTSHLPPAPGAAEQPGAGCGGWSSRAGGDYISQHPAGGKEGPGGKGRKEKDQAGREGPGEVREEPGQVAAGRGCCGRAGDAAGGPGMLPARPRGAASAGTGTLRPWPPGPHAMGAGGGSGCHGNGTRRGGGGGRSAEIRRSVGGEAAVAVGARRGDGRPGEIRRSVRGDSAVGARRRAGRTPPGLLRPARPPRLQPSRSVRSLGCCGPGGSVDDILDDLLGSDDEPSVKSTRASQAAGSSGGRARNPSVQTSKKSFLEDDFYSKLAVEAAEGSSASDTDVQSLGDMDDLDAEILGIPKPGSGPWKTPMKGPGKCDSSRGAVKTKGKLPTPGKDLADPLADLLSDKEQDAPMKAGPTSSKSSCDRKPEESKGKEPLQTPLRTTAPVQRRKELMFEDDDDDDLLEALGFGSHRKEQELRPAHSKLDELFGRGSAAKVLEEPGTGERKEFKLDEKFQKQPEKEEGRDKEDLVFGEYQPSMGSRPSRRQSVRFSAENTCEPKTEPRSKPSPPASLNPVRRRGSGGDWLGLKDEVFFDSEPPSPVKTSMVGVSPSPASQLPAAEEAAAAKTGPQEQEDWLMAALARKKARALAKAEEREAKPLEAAGEGPRPRSPLSQPTASSAAAAQQAAAPQDTAASTDGSRGPVPWLSTAKPASVNPSETAKEDPSGDANAMVPTALLPGEEEIPSPAPLTQAEAPALDVLPEKRLGAPTAQLCEETSGCRAELLSAQARVAELESQVQTLEMQLAEQKLLLERVQQRHQEDLDLQKNTHRTLMKVLEETYEQREETYRQREEMLRWQKEQLLAEMEQRRQDAEQERAELLEQHQLALDKLREMQRASVLKMRKDQEEQLQHLKWLKEQEMDAVTSAFSHTRSLNGVTDLHDPSCKVKAIHHSTSQELATEAQQWDTQLRMLQDRLSQQQKDMEEERRWLRELAAKTEARLDKQTRLLEQERVELKMRSQELKAKEEQLGKDQERLDEAWKELRMEKEKVNDAALHVQQQEEEMENTNKLLAQKIAEARRIESEHQATLQDMLQNLEQLKQQQERLHQGSVPSASPLGLGLPGQGSEALLTAFSPFLPGLRKEKPSRTCPRRQPEREELLKHPATSLTAAQDLSAPSNGLSSTTDLSPLVETPPRHKFRDIREIMAVADRALLSAQVQTLRFQVQKENYSLEDEKLFLESMKKASYNTSSPLASRPSFSGL